MRDTRTYAILPVSKRTFDEIRSCLDSAGSLRGRDLENGCLLVDGLAVEIGNPSSTVLSDDPVESLSDDVDESLWDLVIRLCHGDPAQRDKIRCVLRPYTETPTQDAALVDAQARIAELEGLRQEAWDTFDHFQDASTKQIAELQHQRDALRAALDAAICSRTCSETR